MIRIPEADLHSHLRARMAQRGVTKEEIERTLNDGWDADDSKTGTYGKVFIFAYNGVWEGEFFEEKEVRAYYKLVNDTVMLLTVKTRYGKGFPRKEVGR